MKNKIKYLPGCVDCERERRKRRKCLACQRRVIQRTRRGLCHSCDRRIGQFV